MRALVPPAVAVLAIAVTAHAQDPDAGQASGTLEVRGVKVTLKHAYLAPDRPGHSRLVLSDVPLEPKQVKFSSTLDQLARDGTFHGVEVKLGPSGASVEQWIYFKDVSATPSWLAETPWTREGMTVQKDSVKGGLKGSEPGRYAFSVRFHAGEGASSASTSVAPSEDAKAAPAVPARPPRVTTDTVVRVGGEIAEPRKLRDVAPRFPHGARGSVILEIAVGPQGKVTSATVLRGSPGMDEPAREAALQWIYAPTLVHGVPVTTLMTVSLSAR